MVWHLDSIYCHTEGDGGATIPAGGFFQEQEADQFASALLVPKRFLNGLVQDATLSTPDILDALAVADVSVLAGLLALKEVLPPGVAFLVPGPGYLIKSSGTGMPQQPTLAELQRTAVRTGKNNHQGHVVHWFEFIESRSTSAADTDSRTSAEILRDVVRRVWPSRPGVESRVMSSIGGVLSAQRDVIDPDRLHGIMRHRIETGRFYELLDDPGGEAFLAKRAREIAWKRGWPH